MARFLKNPDLTPGGSQAARLPMVPNSSYGDAPVDGIIRFNSSSSRIEFYYNNTWNQVAKIGTLTPVVDDLVGNGFATVFTMSQSQSDAKNIVVTIGGVYQLPDTAYTVSGATITFTSPPPAPSLPSSPNRINIIHNLNSTNVPA
jgi:hypothetical protein